MSEIKVRVSKKFTLYIPRAVAEAAGVREGDVLRVRVEGSRIILEPALDPFDIALRGPKFARVTFEEFERESEEMQSELFG
ncbi:AbrB/MazE/SpoVT family DNA-binding domain-containing protein [Infirmifilum lucidum]|uniref:AbrB/MazE/SpoVT family DNA-binding domain-containing protein n=1 Tax=Infirmifilum lucidum TaxID=2776706 RepID=A0A7L9FHC8_9CREN|nr:AbrB/MazE/SpoVT family DNA-binding domain-containing protein [Infirmifilum lucidum]QOJ79117.1 AbrB/MazE/SpoVT family DNA-binding domain-containing protein [Infirmifilum lucidum]